MTTVLRAKPIPRTLSASANPGALSFLSLPGEVRNRVYELLVPTNEEIEITRRARDTPTSVVSSLRSNFLLSRKAKCVSLFSSCRQIYHESISLLLSSNTWVLSVGDNWYATEATNLVAWMEILGSSATMLRKVIINLIVIPDNRSHEIVYGDTVEIFQFVRLGNLAKALWADRDAKFKIELAMYDRTNDYEYLPLKSRWRHGKISHAVVSNVLQALGEDSLHLKRYGRQIHDILVSLDSSEGYVHFNYVSPDCSRIGNACGRWFSIADNGTTLSFLPTKRPALMALPKRAKEQIFDSITFMPPAHRHSRNPDCTNNPYPQVCHDLALGTVEGATPILAALNSALRSQYRRQFWHSNYHLIKMRSRVLRTDFNRSNKLRKFLCIASTSYRPWNMGDRFCDVEDLLHLSVELLLEFHLQDATTLNNLRINMLDFLRVTSYCNQISPRITFRITNEDGSTQSQASIRLNRLREFAIVALIEFDLTFPGNKLKPCPNIWINGYGRIIQVERDGKSLNPWVSSRGSWFESELTWLYQFEREKLREKHRTTIKTGSGPRYEEYRASIRTFYNGTPACYLGYLHHTCFLGDVEH